MWIKLHWYENVIGLSIVMAFAEIIPTGTCDYSSQPWWGHVLVWLLTLPLGLGAGVMLAVAKAYFRQSWD